MTHVMSCYEKLRLQNIERNQLFMKQLGFDTTAPVPAEIREKKAKRKVEDIDTAFELRRSHRLACVPAVIHDTEVSIWERSIRTNDNYVIIELMFSMYRMAVKMPLERNILKRNQLVGSSGHPFLENNFHLH